MSEPVVKDKTGPDAEPSADEKRRGVDWEDPSIPVGDAPPLPKWPLVLLGVAWLASMAFLALMVVSRGGSAQV